MALFIRSLLRFSLAAVFLAAALGKGLDLAGFAEILRSYKVFLHFMIMPMAIIVMLAEAILAVWLFSGKYLAEAGWFVLIIHLYYALMGAVGLLRGLVIPNAGSFGVFWGNPLTWLTVVGSTIIIFAGFILYKLARKV